MPDMSHLPHMSHNMTDRPPNDPELRSSARTSPISEFDTERLSTAADFYGRIVFCVR